MIKVAKRLLHITPYVILDRRRRRGVSLIDDLKALFRDADTPTFLDVGANEGQTAQLLCDGFPTAVVHCFEPVEQTFEALVRNMRSYDRVQCHQLALGASAGAALLHRQHANTWNSLAPHLNLPTSDGAEEVTLATVDEFCAAHSIGRIRLLKTDTEGFDAAVLQGARNMLGAGAIDAVFSEVGVHTNDLRHTPLAELLPLLQQYGFYLFALYDLPLRECVFDAEYYNALFVAERLRS